MTLTYKDDGQENTIEGTSVCAFQGAFCGGGAWFEIWHVERATKAVEAPLHNGDKLIFRPDRQCPSMDEHGQHCSGEGCMPADRFSLGLKYSDEKSAEKMVQLEAYAHSKERGQPVSISAWGESVKFSQLSTVGIEVLDLQISLTEGEN